MPEIIRLGDPTSHGGKVLEGSVTDICHGKPIAYMGHKVMCPKCKGSYPIIEGVQTTTLYGRGVAVAGMKTACGATLIATQFTDTVDWSSGASGASGASSAAEKVVATMATGVLINQAVSGVKELFDEQPVFAERLTHGVPYLIVLPDGKQLSGQVDVDGKMQRVATDGIAEYEVFWGDEALARIEGGVT
jgi:uncharacterized Zn-binding protein involved in type VI secretion